MDNKSVNIILDTDIGCDCDDAGAMAVLHALANAGECNIMAVTHCTSRVSGLSCIEVINRYYKRKDIPIAMLQAKGFLSNTSHEHYSKAVSERFENETIKKSVQPCAIKLLREALASAADNSVVIAAIGPLTNISGFLNSPPDELSPLSGRELAKNKVTLLVSMAGFFPNLSPSCVKPADMVAEWNVLQDIPAAQNVADNWPSQIIFSPFEVGAKIKTGRPLLEKYGNENPVRLAYEIFSNISESDGTRESWDQSAVYCAVRGCDDIFELSQNGKVSFDSNGKSLFAAQENGRHRFMILQNEKAQKATEVINSLML